MRKPRSKTFASLINIFSKRTKKKTTKKNLYRKLQASNQTHGLYEASLSSLLVLPQFRGYTGSHAKKQTRIHEVSTNASTTKTVRPHKNTYWQRHRCSLSELLSLVSLFREHWCTCTVCLTQWHLLLTAWAFCSHFAYLSLPLNHAADALEGTRRHCQMLHNLQTSLPSLQSCSASGTEVCLNSPDLDSCSNNVLKINTNWKKRWRQTFGTCPSLFLHRFQVSS